MVLRPIYGLKQSNNIFDKALRDVFLSLKYTSTFDNPSIFVKVNPDNPHQRCTVSMHVDDGLGVCTHTPYRDELLTALTSRFGPLTYNAESTSYTGTSLCRHPTGAVTLSMEGYIRRFITGLGLQDIAPASSPSTADLFHPSQDTTPVSIPLYQHIIGCFIHCLKIGHHIRKEVTFLAGKTSKPTMDDLRKCIRVIRFLNQHPTLGPTYFTTDGPILYGWVDASYGVHTDARSQSGSFLSIGRNSAPFASHTGTQRTCVSTNSMEAEYVALTGLGKSIVSYRRFLNDI